MADVPVPAAGCPARSEVVLCRLRGNNWVAVQVVLVREKKRLGLGDKRPSYGACPRPMSLITTTPTTTTVGPTAPGTPVNLRVVSTGLASASLAWDPPTAGTAVDHYEVLVNGVSVLTTPNAGAVLTGLQAACIYGIPAVIGVQAVDASGQHSDSVTTTVMPVCGGGGGGGSGAPATTTATTTTATTTTGTTTTGTTTTGTTTTGTTTTGTTTSGSAVAVTVSQPLDYSFATGTETVSATATGGTPPYSASLEIDGGLTTLVPVVSGASITFAWDTTQVVEGPYTLDVAVTDSLGAKATSAVLHVTVDNTPPTTYITSSYGVGFSRASLPVAAHASDANGIASVQFAIDGTPVGAAVVAPDTAGGYTYSATLPLGTLSDGTHTLTDVSTDNAGLTIVSAGVSINVDNTPPTAVMYQPTVVPGYSYAVSAGPTTLQVHASDLNGVASVQFTVDGNPVGALLTQPDTPGAYLYSVSFDTSTLSAGMHSISAIVTDNAGNTATAPAVSLENGPFVPVLNYHGIIGPLDENPDEYDQTSAEAAQQLAYLQANGYQSITLEQYETWLTTGALPAGITKPVLITVDDGLTDELAWDPLLQQYGFTAVLFVVTGYADNTTPGANDPTGNMSWSQIQALAANGRWEIAFHAGEYGHADFSDPTSTIDLGGGQTLNYASTCWTYYTCLGNITTGTTTVAETPAQLETQVAGEINAGVTELKQEVPSASLLGWACPWNACGQWTTQYNDPSSTVQAWLPGYLASQFPIVFTQTDPNVYGLASGTVDSLTGDNRRYRFEVLTTTTLAEFAAALTDPTFAAR